jgi:hypothetical protein
MKPTHRLHAFLFGSSILASLAIAGNLQAAVTLTMTELTPGAGNPTVASQGTLGSNNALPTQYTWTGLDFTSVGGSASDQIVFNVSYSQSGGTGVQFNTASNVSVTGGGDNNQVEGTETLTATIALTSTTFAGGLSNLSIAFTRLNIGGFGNVESADVTHAGGTITQAVASGNFVDFAPSSFVTLDPITTTNVNIAGFNAQITAVPEPSTALLGGLGLLALLRRRRA